MKNIKLLFSLIILTTVLVSCNFLKSKSSDVMVNLENTNWTLVKAGDKNFVKNNESPDGITLSFSNGNFSTSDGCNAVGGEFITNNNNISFNKVRNTMRYCDQEFMQKYGYSVAFFSAKKFEIKNNKLYLYEENGKTVIAEYVKK